VCAQRTRGPTFPYEESHVFLGIPTLIQPGTFFAAAWAMSSRSVTIERLWSIEDGTVCLLVERDDAPRFEICVVRDEEVLRQNRLYARGSAQMLAETWRSNLSRVSNRRSSVA
jgi:hypothetical protein